MHECNLASSSRKEDLVHNSHVIVVDAADDCIIFLCARTQAANFEPCTTKGWLHNWWSKTVLPTLPDSSNPSWQIWRQGSIGPNFIRWQFVSQCRGILRIRRYPAHGMVYGTSGGTPMAAQVCQARKQNLKLSSFFDNKSSGIAVYFKPEAERWTEITNLLIYLELLKYW